MTAVNVQDLLIYKKTHSLILELKTSPSSTGFWQRVWISNHCTVNWRTHWKIPWKTVTSISSLFHCKQHSKLCSLENWTVIYSQVNSWFCGASHWKLFLCFPRWSRGVSLQQTTVHQVVTYFKKSDALNTEHENLVMVPQCLEDDSILVHTLW
jgi:hypothetical protein